ncbi:MAG: SDR family NAD(P)-dependent oxidoreductase [Propionibacteriaceae bacterium]|nr:SDR family NAD(P)-dependent oxidoreductase [Propionibacteriaceae bacterium]
MSTWFITGCSTGIGRALAKAVLSHGFEAVVTARDVHTVADLVAGYPDQALAVPLDVMDHDQVLAAVQATIDRFGRLDVLVNNAGYGYRSAVEEAERDATDELFATNFFGPLDLIQQFLPTMRAQGSGRIVNVSSTAGQVSSAGSGLYSATKFALEGMSAGLKIEVEPHGIRVIIVQPGPFRTDFAGRSLKQPDVPIAAYAETVGVRRKEKDTMHGTQAGDPEKAAEAIITAVMSENPPFRFPLGNFAFDVIRTELETHLAELAEWEYLGRPTDF